MTVDTGFNNGEGTIKAYVSANLSLGDRQLAAQFQEVPLDLRMVEAERVGCKIQLNTLFPFKIVDNQCPLTLSTPKACRHAYLTYAYMHMRWDYLPEMMKVFFLEVLLKELIWTWMQDLPR